MGTKANYILRNKNGIAPYYLSEHLSIIDGTRYNLRNRRANIPFARTERYENSFFPYSIKSWNNLGDEAKSKCSVQSFKKYLNVNIRPPGRSFFGVRDTFGIKLLTKIRVTFSDLRDHRFNHNFNCPTPTCSCGIEDETSAHFFLRCPLYPVQRTTLLSNISDLIHSDVTVLPNEHLLEILIYGSNVYNSISNHLILNLTITFIRNTGRFTNLEAFS